jgi:N-acetyl-anhydromuramyl-L-alanine amidase AmpD
MPVKIDQTSLRLPVDQYFQVPQIKTGVVLHFTAGGTAQGALAAWKSNIEQTGTAYIVDRNGTIYEVFPPQCWAYHLGIKKDDPTHREDKRTIGIELVNFGPLRYRSRIPGKDPTGRDGTLYSWPNFWKNPYCLGRETEKYVPKSYRGESFFATYTDDQIVAASALTAYLCDRYSIEPRFLHAASLDQFDLKKAMAHNGILSHQNYRSDKFDVGPAFPWEQFKHSWLTP